MLLLIVQDEEIKLASFPGTDLSPPPPPDLGTRLLCALSIGNSSLFFTTQFLMLVVLQLSLIPRPFSLPSF